MAYVYRHIRLDTNTPFYVGIGTRANHRRSRTIVKRNQHWKNIVAKTEWLAEIIFDDISLKEAKSKEVEFIALYGRSDLGKGPLVNMTDGGDGTFNWIVSDETKAKMSQRNIGKVLSKYHRAKISKAHKGKTFTAETLLKMRNAKIGTKQSQITIEKRRSKSLGNKSRTGQKASPEMREKLRAAQKLRRSKETEFKNANQ